MIRDFLKPTKKKIGLTVLFFTISILLSNIYYFPLNNERFKLFSIPEKISCCLFAPNVCIDAQCFPEECYNKYWNKKLAEVPQSCLSNLCFHQKTAFFLFSSYSANYHDYQDLILAASLYFVFPLNIIYYYFLSCLFVSFLKIKKRGKR